MKVPGNESSRALSLQGANWPGWVLLADSVQGANGPGSEKARYLVRW